MIGIKDCLTKAIYFFESFRKTDVLCPYCRKQDYKIIFRKYGMININECQSCFLLWTNPIFTFPRFYDHLYEGEDASNKNFEPVLKTLKSLKPEGKTLLDFGSSWGDLLHQAKTYGFDPLGIEISKRRAQSGRTLYGVKVIEEIDPLIKQKMTFDFIVALHTLEHLPRNSDIFDKFYQLLATDGVLLIQVPEIDLNKKPECFNMMGAVHPLGYTENFFRKNLGKHGFDCKICKGYSKLTEAYQDERGNLVVLCRKQ